MKTLQNSLMAVAVICLGLFIFSCKKSDDKANVEPEPIPKVKTFNYGSRTITGSTIYDMPGITKEEADSYAFLAYYNPALEQAAAWYAVPGYGSGALYVTRSFVYQTSENPVKYGMSLRIVNSTGAAYLAPIIFTKFKIVLIPQNEITNVSATKVDLSDYETVKKLYKLPN